MLTYNRLADVSRSIERMLALAEAAPIVVVDNGSSDGTAAGLRGRFPGVQVIALPDNRGAAGRNEGLRALSTRYVAFCDDDTWWAPGALARAAELLDAHPRLAVVTARVLVGEHDREDPACQNMAASPLGVIPGLPGVAVLGFLAGASMVRRSAFLAAGGFERRLFLGGEEELLAIDLVSHGWAMAYVGAVVVHHHPSAYRDSARRRRLLARNALWVSWLRRPLPSALRHTVRTLRAGAGDRLVLLGCLDALSGAWWIARRRRVVTAPVEAMLRAVRG
jgi:GT2 family glycosyltransferase